MGIFSAIMDRLRRHGSASAAQPSSSQGAAASQSPTGSAPAAQPQSSASPAPQPQTAGAPSTAQPLQNVDVDAVLADLAAKKGGGGNYRQSIVDLLKLLDLDSSLAARKELAEELGVHAGAHGSAEQNIALHKAVMRKLAENGGKVPESLRS